MTQLMMCDDHVLVTQGLELMLRDETEFTVEKIVSSGKEALQYLRRPHNIDILILDLSMPEMDGIEVLQALRSSATTIKVLILTMHDKVDHLKKAMALGAEGYLLKNTHKDLLIKVLKIIADGGTYVDHKLTEILMRKLNEGPKKKIISPIQLTQREIEILKLIVKNYKTKDIADALFISVNTVLSHRKNIYSKFDVHSVSELINYVYENKYLEP